MSTEIEKEAPAMKKTDAPGCGSTSSAPMSTEFLAWLFESESGEVFVASFAAVILLLMIFR